MPKVVSTVRNLDGLSPRWRLFAEPFEVWLAGACILTGISTPWSSKTRPQSLVHQLSPWLLHAWGVLLVVGGAATLVARWRIGRWAPEASVTALTAAFRLEVAGMVCVATAVGVYALAILAVGRAGLAAGLLTMAPAWACAVRARIVARQLRIAEQQETGADD